MPQDEINRLLVERGRWGQTVVRLKGGDPFVFGRGGEEALALLAAGVRFEVVPGVTAAVAAPAYAGVPVTHRGRSTSFTVVTGHSRHALDRETDWAALVAAGGTIVVLMGVAHRAEIASRLIEGGMDPATPVVAVMWGTRPDQTTVRTTLAGLGVAPVEPPATIVVGEVAGLDLRWFEARPLFGRRVVVTRPPEQASGLSDPLAELGAEPIEVPTIALAEPADGGAALRAAAATLTSGGYDWVVFTSGRAVERFLPLLRDARAFGSAGIAAIGPGTAASLAGRNLVADLVPPEYVAESLVEAFPAGRGRVLLPRAARRPRRAPRRVAGQGLERGGGRGLPDGTGCPGSRTAVPRPLPPTPSPLPPRRRSPATWTRPDATASRPWWPASARSPRRRPGRPASASTWWPASTPWRASWTRCWQPWA